MRDDVIAKDPFVDEREAVLLFADRREEIAFFQSDRTTFGDEGAELLFRRARESQDDPLDGGHECNLHQGGVAG